MSRGILIDPPKPLKVRGVNRIRIARINPYMKARAIIFIDANMRAVRKAVGSKHVGLQAIGSIGGIPIHVCCDNSLSAGPIWRVKDSLPVRGSGIILANMGYGPADFPGDSAWLEANIEWEPEGVEKAINDPLVPSDAAQEG